MSVHFSHLVLFKSSCFIAYKILRMETRKKHIKEQKRELTYSSPKRTERRADILQSQKVKGRQGYAFRYGPDAVAREANQFYPEDSNSLSASFN